MQRLCQHQKDHDKTETCEYVPTHLSVLGPQDRSIWTVGDRAQLIITETYLLTEVFSFLIRMNLFTDMKNIKHVIYTLILFLNSEPRNEFVVTFTRGYLDYRICSWKQMRSALFSPRFNDTPTLPWKVIKTFNCVGNIVRRNQTKAWCKEDGKRKKRWKSVGSGGASCLEEDELVILNSFEPLTWTYRV